MSTDSPVYLVTGIGPDREVYHTDSGCRALGRANNYRQVGADVPVRDRRECRICSGEAESAPSDTDRLSHCRICGDTLDDDGTCRFCAAIDAC